MEIENNEMNDDNQDNHFYNLPKYYLILLAVLNTLLIAITWPQKGYGVMIAMLSAPILNLICFIVFLIISYNLRKETGKHSQHSIVFLFITLLFIIAVYLVANLFFNTSGN